LNNNRLGDDYVPVLISLEGLEDAETNAQIFRAIASEIAVTLNIDIPEHDKFDATNSYFRYDFLEKKVKPQLNQRKLLLMIDEYEKLEACIDNSHTKVNPTIFLQFRYLMQHYGWISFIWVGSHKLEELNTDYWKEFTGTVYHTISFLDGKSARELIRQPTSRLSVHYTPNAVQQLLELSGNHPLFLQSLCHFAFSNGSGKGKITKQDIVTATELCIEAIQNLYASIWLDFKDDEKVILSTMAHLNANRINISDIALQLDHFKINWSLKRIKNTIQQLERKEVLKKTELEQYQYCASFFKECVKTYQSLENVLEELNVERKEDTAFIHNPEILKAESNLRVAEEYAQLGEVEKAEKTFQYVMETCPNYIDSWLQFGRFYESQGEWDKALEIYRNRLSQYSDSVEASNAIGLLLKKNYQLKEALKQFQVSLEIQKSNIVALANIEEIEQWLLSEENLTEIYYPVELYITGKTRPSLFADIVSAIAKTDTDIMTSSSEASATQLKVSCVVNVLSRNHLNKVIRSIQNVRSVYRAEWIYSTEKGSKE
jgi:tetratricopeptide (TPR) repeat protein